MQLESTASSTPRQARNATNAASKREQVPVACSRCRVHKVKCDGVRPTCARCESRRTTCTYDVAAGTTRQVAIKRKASFLEDENQQLHTLFAYIRTRPPDDVSEIIKRIRNSSDLLEVLRFARDGDLSLQQRLQRKLPDPRMIRVNAESLQETNLRLPARPWTAVAGNGIVSDLVSRFFDIDQPFFCAMVDHSAFVSDIRASDPESARYCSPMLVNAICALGAFTSPYARAIDVAGEKKLSDLFFDEARRHLDREEGKASVPSIQALCVMFLYCMGVGKDRLGQIYRYACCDMYKRMKAGTKFPKDLNALTTTFAKHRQLFSRFSWGVVHFETHVSSTYSQPALLGIPTIPCEFTDDAPVSPHLDWSGTIGSARIFTAKCQGTVIFAKIAAAQMSHPGSTQDISSRMNIYKELNQWAQTLSPMACYPSGRVSEYHFLSATYHLYALLLFRPLSHLDLEIEAPINRPEDFCLKACTYILAELDYWERIPPCSSSQGTIATLWFYFFTSFTLITHLGSNPASREPLTRACLKLHSFVPYWPLVSVLLSGIKAFAQQLDVQLPPETMSCFLDVGKNLPRDADGDVPITWALPHHSDLLELLSDDGNGDDSDPQRLTAIGMGLVIAKWNKMSLDGS